MSLATNSVKVELEHLPHLVEPSPHDEERQPEGKG